MADQPTLAQAMARQLAAWGVKFVFGVIGDDILPLLDALAAVPAVRYIPAAHETGAAFMAYGLARLTGEPGVCVASSPGAISLAQGLAAAYMDGAPVLAITGQVPAAKVGTTAKQYFHQQALMAGFTCFAELAQDAPAALKLLIRALSRARLRRAPAHLAIPADLWTRPVAAKPGTLPPLAAGPATPGPLQGDLPRALALMRQSSRPLLLAGLKAAGAAGEVERLARAWGAGVVVAQEAKGVLPDAWPQVVGGIGEAWTPGLVADADCVLVIGQASFETGFLPKTPVIQVEAWPWDIDDAYLWDSLAGAIPSILATLAEGLAGFQPDPAWLERIGAARAERNALIAADLQNQDFPLHPSRLMAALSQVVARDAIIALDEGAFNHWFDRAFQAEAQTILLSHRWRSMGAGLPLAIAAKLGCPERQVLALAGDGGLLMSLGELATAAQLRLPLAVIVASNRLYGLEKDKALTKGLHPAGLAVPAADFAQCAAALGARGFKVEDAASLAATLRQALASGSPCLVDVPCRDVRLPALGS